MPRDPPFPPQSLGSQAWRIARLSTLGLGGLMALLAARDRALQVMTSPLVQLGAANNKVVVPDAVALRSGDDLIRELRKGGYVLFMRHFQTDHSKWHVDPLAARHGLLAVADFRSCRDQRLLTDYGRNRARLVGQAMRLLEIPIGHVVSSPYCRATEGVELMLRRKPDELDVDLIYRAGSFTREGMSEHLLPILGERPRGATNTLVMAHRPQMDDVAPIAEGETFVFEPGGGTHFKLVGKVTDEEWTDALGDHYLLGLNGVEVALGLRAAAPLQQ